MLPVTITSQYVLSVSTTNDAGATGMQQRGSSDSDTRSTLGETEDSAGVTEKCDAGQETIWR
jgi:hypothetical protein